jgi:hypothetical protein
MHDDDDDSDSSEHSDDDDEGENTDAPTVEIRQWFQRHVYDCQRATPLCSESTAATGSDSGGGTPESLDSTEPLRLFVEPIHAVDHGDTVVAYIQSVLEWQYLFSNIPVMKILGVVENTWTVSLQLQKTVFKISGFSSV